MARLLFLLLIVWLAAPQVRAQEGGEGGDQPAASDRIETMQRALEGDASLVPQIVPADLLDAESTASMQRALTGYYEYRAEGYRHRQRVFGWQLVSSQIIFALVAFLVLAGVYFSWLQFSASLKGGKQAGEAPAETSFEASPTGFKVSSPVLGVIILAISLAFFYLYLVHVYPITDAL
jgi:hypothetical protein